MNKLLLVDGSGLLFQMFYGMPARIIGKSGKPIHASVGFIGALIKVIKRTDATHVIVIFDGETGNFRSELSDSYKANRIDYSSVPEEETPFSQLDDIKQVLACLGIMHYEVTENYEADDVIASYALSVSGSDRAVIMSADKDYFQLISESVSVFTYRGKQSVMYDEEAITSKFGIKPHCFADYKSLIGDPSDNIAGLPGVGPKTAAELINDFGGVDDIIAHSGEIKRPSVKKAVSDNAEKLILNKKLITLSADAPVPYPLDRLMVNSALPDTSQALRLAGLW